MPKYVVHFGWHRHPRTSSDIKVFSNFIDVLEAIRKHQPHFTPVDKVVRVDSDSGKEAVIFSENKWCVELLSEHEKQTIKKYVKKLGWELPMFPSL